MNMLTQCEVIFYTNHSVLRAIFTVIAPLWSDLHETCMAVKVNVTHVFHQPFIKFQDFV